MPLTDTAIRNAKAAGKPSKLIIDAEGPYLQSAPPERILAKKMASFLDQ